MTLSASHFRIVRCIGCLRIRGIFLAPCRATERKVRYLLLGREIACSALRGSQRLWRPTPFRPVFLPLQGRASKPDFLACSAINGGCASSKTSNILGYGESLTSFVTALKSSDSIRGMVSIRRGSRSGWLDVFRCCVPFPRQKLVQA